MSMLLTEDIKTTDNTGQSKPEAAGPLWTRLRTWWLLLPLMYFATDGQIIASQHGTATTAAGLSAVQIAVGLCFWFLAILQIAPAYKIILRACLRYRALTLFMGYVLVSSLWSADIVDSMRKAGFLSILILFGYFIAEKYRPEEQMRLIFAVGCLAVAGSYLIVAMLPSRGLDNQGHWTGLFGHKSALGDYLGIYLLPFFFMSRRMTLFRLFGLGAVLLGIGAIYLSESRTGWVTCAFLSVYVCLSRILKKFKSTSFPAIIFVFFSLIGVLGWIAFENLSSLMRLLGKDTSLTGRTDIWKDAIWAISRHLFFGYGYSGFWNGLTPESSAVNVQISSALNGQEIYHAHNAFLNVTLQIGIVGMAVLGIVLLNAFRSAIRSIFVFRSKAALWYLGILLALLVAGADESTFMNYLSLMSVLLVLACVGLHKISRGEVG